MALALNTGIQAVELLESAEIAMNVMGYVPIVGTVSAVTREYLGLAEVVSGVALTVFGLIELGNNAGVGANGTLQLGLALTGHGVLNRVRARTELVPFVPWLLCLPWDIAGIVLTGKRVFSYLP